MDDVTATHDRDQYHAERREEATALGRDVAAYHGALKDAGIEGELLATLTRQFNASWITDGDVTIEMMYAEADE